MVDRTGLGERFASEMSLEEPEVPLYETSKERQQYDEMANLYAIIMATEHLERAFVQDAIDQKTYTYECKRLISQFGVAEHVLRDQMSTETFMNVYQMDCPRAVERLLVQGVPQAMKGGDSNVNHAATVAGMIFFNETRPLPISTTHQFCFKFFFVQKLCNTLSPLWMPCAWSNDTWMNYNLCFQI
mmetsp:Transcript_27557/g.57657  ORF Transcript_27557/g.57657 Transcript_27557/m.57657 type:complete len:186 (-) Transcript_27557:258-815(-)